MNALPLGGILRALLIFVAGVIAASAGQVAAAPATAPHIVILATGGTIASGSERALSGFSNCISMERCGWT